MNAVEVYFYDWMALPKIAMLGARRTRYVKCILLEAFTLGRDFLPGDRSGADSSALRAGGDGEVHGTRLLV